MSAISELEREAKKWEAKHKSIRYHDAVDEIPDSLISTVDSNLSVQSFTGNFGGGSSFCSFNASAPIDKGFPISISEENIITPICDAGHPLDKYFVNHKVRSLEELLIPLSL